jgi:very-short-patch-repair endonuclease
MFHPKLLKGLKEKTMSIGDNVSIFYDAKAHIFEKAKALRKNMTDSELILWEYLKGKQLLGLRFRPQHPIDIFIADFYCHPIKLVIEIDGGIHKNSFQKEYDIGRTAELNYWGTKVIRFTNEEIECDIEQVIKEIKQISKLRLSEMKQSPLQGI